MEKKESMRQKNSNTEKHLPSFESLRQVVKHLDGAGFKISKSKISRDKGKGLIQVNADGSIYETEVRAYAATLERKNGSVDDLNDVHARKTAREVESIELKIRKQQFELDLAMKKYFPRQDFEAELAARAAIFETGLKHRFTTMVSELIALVGGQPEKGPDLLERLTMALEAELTQYATTKTFQVVFFDNEESL
jgi:hypothetical protein